MTIYLTYDTDHMNELAMEYFLTEMPDIPATFFCTQIYECLKGTNFEIAPHPNLNNCSDIKKELYFWREVFPDAIGWRSHSCLFSHIICELLYDLGYKYSSVATAPSAEATKFYRYAYGLYEAPIYYMDSLDFSQQHFWPSNSHNAFSNDIFLEIENKSDKNFIFCLHPIHLMLNTPNREYYFERREEFKHVSNFNAFKKLRYTGDGTLSFAELLIKKFGHQIKLLADEFS